MLADKRAQAQAHAGAAAAAVSKAYVTNVKQGFSMPPAAATATAISNMHSHINLRQCIWFMISRGPVLRHTLHAYTMGMLPHLAAENVCRFNHTNAWAGPNSCSSLQYTIAADAHIAIPLLQTKLPLHACKGDLVQQIHPAISKSLPCCQHSTAQHSMVQHDSPYGKDGGSTSRSYLPHT